MSDEHSSTLPGLVDALYSRLLLRDFFGKIVPGSIILLSICLVTFPSDALGKFIDHLSFLSGLLVIGFAWLLAFALQAFGEAIRVVHYHDCETNAEFFAKRHKFHICTAVQQHQQLERLAVIREACGNGYLALVLSSVFLTLNTVAMQGPRALAAIWRSHWPVIVFGAILVAFLAVMHFVHVKRQSDYIDSFLATKGDQDI